MGILDCIDSSTSEHNVIKLSDFEDDFVIPSTEGVDTKANGILRASDGSTYVYPADLNNPTSATPTTTAIVDAEETA